MQTQIPLQMLSDPNARDRKKYTGCRQSLFIVAALTAVNVILIAANMDFSFLFSSTLPQIIISYGMAFSDYYGVAAALLAAGVCLLIVGAYLLCALMAKKKLGWLVAALVLYILDFISLLWFMITSGEIASLLLNLLFNAAILFLLIRGVVIGKKAAEGRRVFAARCSERGGALGDAARRGCRGGCAR